MKSIYLLLFLFSFAFGELLYVSELFRHGARYTNHKFYDYNESWQDEGELTGVGMRQHFNLGRYLRQDYIEKVKFLNQTFDHRQFQVYSTQSHRTMESGLSHLYGMYPENTGPRIPADIEKEFLLPPYKDVIDSMSGASALVNGNQAFPMHNGALYLNNCPNSDQLSALMLLHYAKEYVEIDTYYTPLYIRMRNLFGIKPIYELNLLTMTMLYDTLIADQYLGRSFPKGFDYSDLMNLRHLTHWLMVLVYSGNFSAALSTPLMQKIIADFDYKLAHPKSQKKWTMFSGHDTNVAPTITFLNLSSASCIQDKWRGNKLDKYLNCEDGPDFAANLLIELHNDPEPYVKIKYNGNYAKLCEKDKVTCAYSEWKQRIEAQYVNYKQICGLKQKQAIPSSILLEE